MDKSILDDELWALIAPFLPPPKLRRAKYPERMPLDDRVVLAGILFVLQNGMPWEMLPGTGLWFWHELLATASGLAGSRGLGPLARLAAGTTAPCRPD